MKAFTIRDTKAEVFNTPFFQKTIGEAERSLARMLNDENSMVAMYPEDFDLYYLGDYDDNTGKGEWLDSPQHITKAVNLRPHPTES